MKGKSTMSKINGLISEAIKTEQRYQEEKRIDWMFTKKMMRQIMEDLLPEGTKVYCGFGSVTIRVPWGVENLRQARKAMGSGWRFGNNYTDTSGTLTKSYYIYDGEVDYTSTKHRGSCYLSLIMDATELTSESCKRIEVGEKVFTQKVYKVICEDSVTEILGKAEQMDEETKVTY
jgi:hypothetical protein